jgi:hypothetical protein
MSVSQPRGLGNEFLKDLKDGFLSPLLKRVKQDKTLCLELRSNYINVYYRGGNLMEVSEVAGVQAEYKAFFDPEYLSRGELQLPPSRLREPAHVAAWLTDLPRLKQAMDVSGKLSEEREVQQNIARDNNIGGVARATDFYVCDIEYASEHGRFDMIAVHWPSTPSARKEQHDRRLVLAEVKYGDGALGGKAGLHDHIDDVNQLLAFPANVAALKREMVAVFNQKRELELINCEKDLEGFSTEKPQLLLVLVNHDPGKSELRKLLQKLPPSPHADVCIANACLLGYGLFDPAVLPLEKAMTRFETCI